MKQQNIISSRPVLPRADVRADMLPWAVVASYLLLAIVALLPRALDLGLFVNADEVNYWLKRSELFLDALQRGDYPATAISRHPGVTTMWLGSAGILLRKALLEWGLIQDQGFPTLLALSRLPGAIVHTIGILVGYGLLRRLLPPLTAALAALLWAADPFVIAYTRLLHVDGFASTFIILCILAACVFWHHGARLRWLLLSGFCGGLALLSKSPALILFPVVGLVGLAAGWRAGGWRGWWAAAVRPLLIWGLAAALTATLFWPAIWSAPYQVFDLLHAGVVGEAMAEHQGGNFYLGEPNEDPPWHFYPAATAIRLTPWALLGVLVLPWAWHAANKETRRDLSTFALLYVLFVIALSYFTKKLNRYLIPAFPALDILAAVGLVMLAERIGHARRLRGALAPLLLATTAVAAVVNAAYWHPYGIVAFNQLFGGARGGIANFGAGSGEGYDQVAAWLNKQPDITGVVTISPLASSLQPFLRPGAQAIDVRKAPVLPEQAGYVVVYIRRVQQTPIWPPLDQFYGKLKPQHVVQLKGAEYAWIYQVPPRVANEVDATFGDTVHLNGFTVAGGMQPGSPITVKLAWDVLAPPPDNYMLFAHLIGTDGERAAQIDVSVPTKDQQAGRHIQLDVPLALPANARPGTYRLLLGMYKLDTGERLPLKSRQRADPALDGNDALLLTELRVK